MERRRRTLRPVSSPFENIMAEMKTVDFNALPRAVRERLIGCMARKRKPKPILVQPSITGLQIFLWVMLGVGSFIGVMISPEFLLGDSDASVGAAVGAAVLLALSLGCGLLAVLGLLRSVTQALALPFA